MMRRSSPEFDALLAAITEPAIWLRRTRDKVTASKLGGLPWLRSGELWPRGSFGQPLHFLAQVDLAALPRTPLAGDTALRTLPTEGMLFFFADMDEIQVWGGERGFESPPYTAVVFGVAGAGPCAAPDGLPFIKYTHCGRDEGIGISAFPEAWLAPSVFHTCVPNLHGAFRRHVNAYGLPWNELVNQAELRDVESAERGAGVNALVLPPREEWRALALEHRQAMSEAFKWAPARYSTRELPMGGTAWSAELARHTMLGPPSVVQTVGRDALERGWIPLLQLDTDVGLHREFMFCDSGMAQFWITPEDLAARRFDRAWATTEGG